MEAKGFGLPYFRRVVWLVDAIVLLILVSHSLVVFVGELVPLHLEGMLLLSKFPDPVWVRIRMVSHIVFVFFDFNGAI